MRHPLIVAFAIVFLASVGLSHAGEKAPAKKMKVTLVVILAGEDGGDVDPRLKQIAEEIRKQNPQLKSFKLQSMTNRDLVENEKSVFNLIDQKTLDVTVKHGQDTEGKVGIGVNAPEQGEFEYRTVCGKFLPIVTRYQTKNRDRLILALRVEPCAK
jgi:hypothetical protein